MSRVHRLLATAALLAALAGCGVREPARAPAGGTAEMASEPDELRRVFFGDLHVQGKEGVLFYTRQQTVLSRW